MSLPLMKCGHIGNAIDTKTNKPCCVICYGNPESMEVMINLPNLDNRIALCVTCNKTKKPSSLNLAFFEYRGPNSPYALDMCKCGYYRVGHGRSRWACDQFCAVGPQEFDTFYCGCRGWN